MGFFNIFGKKEQPQTPADTNTGSGAPEVMAPVDVQVQKDIEAAEHGQRPLSELDPKQEAALKEMNMPEQSSSNSGQ